MNSQKLGVLCHPVSLVDTAADTILQADNCNVDSCKCSVQDSRGNTTTAGGHFLSSKSTGIDNVCDKCGVLCVIDQ